MSVEVLSSKEHTARVKHVCNLCGGIINVGERYNADFCVDSGYAYTFKTHTKCSFISDEIVDYLDLEDEMDRMNFCYGCAEVSEVFICPDCEEYEHCQKSFCIDRMHKFFSRYELYVAERVGMNKTWKVRERKMPF